MALPALVKQAVEKKLTEYCRKKVLLKEVDDDPTGIFWG